MIKRVILFIIAFCLSYSYGARENISLDLQIGFSGVSSTVSKYTPVKAVITNQGSTGFRGFIGVEGQTVVKVELAPEEKKTYFYLLSGGGGKGKFNVFSEKRKPILSRSIPEGVTQDEPIQLILPPKAISALPWLVGVGADDLPPDWRAYTGVALMVVEGNALEKLDSQQRESIRQWLVFGGRMIIVGNDDLVRGIGEFTASLIPVRDVRKVNLPHPPTAFLASPYPPRDIPTTIYPAFPIGKVNIYENGYPLMVERKIGWGIVEYWAFQPWAEPFNDWQGMQLILPPSSPRTPLWWTLWNDFPYNQFEEWALFPTKLKGMGKISFKFVLIVSLIYAYLLIPSLYIGLRIKRKTNAYWLASLICTFIVSLAIILYGWATKEHQITLNELSLTYLYPDVGIANQMGIAGIYSPRTMDFSLSLERKETIVKELQTCEEPEGFFYIEDGKKRVEDLRVPAWGMRTYEYSDWREEKSPVSAQLSLDDDELRGWIENKSSQPMRNAMILFGQRVYAIGDIGVGEGKEISLDLEKSNPLIGMELGSIFYTSEEMMNLTPAGRTLRASNRGNLTNCALLWESENAHSIGEVQPSPAKVYRKSIYIQYILLPVSKLPSRIVFVSPYLLPRLPGSEEALPFFPPVPQLMLGSPFEFSSHIMLVFKPKIEGVSFKKVVLDIQLESKAPVDISLSLRQGKKTYKTVEVAKGRSPGHITYTIDKPEEFLAGGLYLYAMLERETPLFFGKIKIKGITVYGIPKGG